MYNKSITCCSCRGLFSFDEFEGNIVLCNLTTRQLKRLPPPPKSKPRFELFARGPGYDSKSDDFKVIRFLEQDGGYNRKETCELYSLKNGVWKDIPTPDVLGIFLSPKSGVYVGGRCYWTTKLGSSFGGSSTEHAYDILSFDFTTESFHCLHSPPSNKGEDIAFEVVEYRGSLGAIGFSTSNDATRGFGFEFWVREECSWTKVFDVVLFNVDRVPVELIDGRFLFLKRKVRSNELLVQLVVYDWITKEWKELDIYDYERQMEVCPYVEGQVALPDAMPMQRYESDHTNEEDDDDNGDSYMSTYEDEDEDEDEGRQINKRRRERSDDDDDSCEDDSGDSCKDEEDNDDSGDSCMSTDDEEENDDDDDDDYKEDGDEEADDR